MKPILAVRDPGLRLRVLEQRALRYSSAAAPDLDRPAFVRAASAITRFGAGWAVVQDDANFVALLEDDTVTALTLPTGEAGRRQFSDALGNKRFKLDLEAAVVDGDNVLYAFGSGSSGLREQIVEILETGEVRVHHAPEFYAALRANRTFAPGQLNLEGAVLIGDTLRLFSRGNGAARDGLEPKPASAGVSWRALLNHLQGAPPPTLETVQQYDLGAIGGAPLGFTDAAVVGGRVLYTASAEPTADAVLDAPVTGSAIGVFDPDGGVRWAMLEDKHGAPLPAKLEGITATDQANEVLVVLDADDADAPGALWRVGLEGGWFVS